MSLAESSSDVETAASSRYLTASTSCSLSCPISDASFDSAPAAQERNTLAPLEFFIPSGTDPVAFIQRTVPQLSHIRWRRGARVLRLNVPYRRGIQFATLLRNSGSAMRRSTWFRQSPRHASVPQVVCESMRFDDRLVLTSRGREYVAAKKCLRAWKVWTQKIYCGGQPGCRTVCGAAFPACAEACSAPKNPDQRYAHNCPVLVELSILSTDLSVMKLRIPTLSHGIHPHKKPSLPVRLLLTEELKNTLIHTRTVTKRICSSRASYSPLSAYKVNPRVIAQFFYNRHRANMRHLSYSLNLALGISNMSTPFESAEAERWRAAAGFLLENGCGKDAGLAFLDLARFKIDSGLGNSVHIGVNTPMNETMINKDSRFPVIAFVSPDIHCAPQHLMFDVKHSLANGVAVACVLGCMCSADGSSAEIIIRGCKEKRVVAVAVSTTGDVECEGRLVNVIALCLRRKWSVLGEIDPIVRVLQGDDAVADQGIQEGNDCNLPQVTVDLNSDVQARFRAAGFRVRISLFHILVQFKRLLDELNISKSLVAACLLVFKCIAFSKSMFICTDRLRLASDTFHTLGLSLNQLEKLMTFIANVCEVEHVQMHCDGFETTSPAEAFHRRLGSFQLLSLLETISGRSVEQAHVATGGIFLSQITGASEPYVSKAEVIAMLKFLRADTDVRRITSADPIYLIRSSSIYEQANDPMSVMGKLGSKYPLSAEFKKSLTPLLLSVRQSIHPPSSHLLDISPFFANIASEVISPQIWTAQPNRWHIVNLSDGTCDCFFAVWNMNGAGRCCHVRAACLMEEYDKLAIAGESSESDFCQKIAARLMDTMKARARFAPRGSRKFHFDDVSEVLAVYSDKGDSFLY